MTEWDPEHKRLKEGLLGSKRPSPKGHCWGWLGAAEVMAVSPHPVTGTPPAWAPYASPVKWAFKSASPGVIMRLRQDGCEAGTW